MKLFVYGTLRTGQWNHHLLAGSRSVGVASTRPRFRFVNLGGFPGLTRGGAQSVVGEIFDVTPDTLARIDRLEGHPDFYRRQTIVLQDGRRVQVYVLNDRAGRDRPIIASGDWTRKGPDPCRSD